jgi:hypothetical protein
LGLFRGKIVGLKGRVKINEINDLRLYFVKSGTPRRDAIFGEKMRLERV